MIDAAGSMKRAAPPESDAANRGLRKAKFAILFVVFISAIFGLQTSWILDPIVAAARFVSLNLIPIATFLLNAFFIFLIRDLHAGGGVVDAYHALKSSILGVHVHYFPHSFLILAFFLCICGAALIKERLWCRMLCPLGALYALVARFSLLRRVIQGCVQCKRCKSACRMGAIRDDADYAKGECILCMDCVYECPPHITKFVFKQCSTAKVEARQNDRGGGPGISRANFIFLVISSILGLGASFGKRTSAGTPRVNVIRPPGSLKEERFVDRCVRCGNCMKVCPTNGLQPVMLESGIEGMWTPRLVPEIGYCEYNCTLCGNVCPTGAIPRLALEAKKKMRLGLAEIDRSICIPWAHGKTCIVCEEHCPISNKAIKLDRSGTGSAQISRPYVDMTLCIGCGICQAKCPVRPVRAIGVSPQQADRT